MIHPLTPDLLLLGLAFLVMALDLLFLGNSPRGFKMLFHVTWVGLAVIFASLFAVPSTTAVTYLGSYCVDGFGLIMRALFTLSALLTIILARPWFTASPARTVPLKHPAEFLYLLLFATGGSFCVVSARDLLTLFISLELATIPLYVLSAYDKHSRLSAEASTKFVVMGSVATAVMLFGYSYIYGVTGSLRFEDIAASVAANPNATMLMLSLMLILGAIAFKLALAPFHMWAPDVYAGSPLPVTAFLSVTSKATAFGFLIILFTGPFAPLWNTLKPWVLILSGATMVAGNLGALRQNGFLRFMAYSSIAQAGYILLAFLGSPEFARASVTYYLFLYAAANFSMFFIMAAVGERRGELISSLRGLSQAHPGLAALLATALFSLAGIPPTAGFTGKFMLFGSAAEAGYYNMIIFAALNSTVSLYYYLQLMRTAYITPAPDEPQPVITLGPLRGWVLIALFIATLALGLWPNLSTAILRITTIAAP